MLVSSPCSRYHFVFNLVIHSKLSLFAEQGVVTDGKQKRLIVREMDM